MSAKFASALISILFLTVASILQRPALADDNHVDLLLVLAADISRSVDEGKFKLHGRDLPTP